MFKRIMENIASFVTDVVAPRTCPACGRTLLRGERCMCLSCFASLPRTGFSGNASPLRRFVDNGIAEPGFCASWFFYNPTSPSADIIRKAKYADRPALARGLGRMFASELIAAVHDEPEDFDDDAPATMLFSDVDVLLPVPMHWRKLLKRGYNQSRQVALGLADVGKMPVGDNLVAASAHSTQTRKGNAARHENIAGTIILENPHELDGLHIAIVDDIITSGATAAECVRAISTSGARPASIGVISLGLTV